MIDFKPVEKLLISVKVESTTINYDRDLWIGVGWGGLEWGGGVDDISLTSSMSTGNAVDR